MNPELPEFGLTARRLKHEIHQRMGAIAELLPLITTNEQWQAILDKVQPDLREEVRGLLEPMLQFQVPGGLPQEPEEVRRIIYGSTEACLDAIEEGEQPESHQREHQGSDAQRPVTPVEAGDAEAGSSGGVVEGGQVEQEVAPDLPKEFIQGVDW